MEEQVSLPDKPKFTTIVPRTDIDLGDVAQSVATKWATQQWLTLLWTTQPEFLDATAAYNSVLTSKNNTKSTRPQVTRALRLLDKTIDDAIAYVKGYLLDKYGKGSADAYYAAFGIVHSGERFVMPVDRQSRAAALEMMINGISAEGFNDRPYGKDFWQNILNEYAPLASQSKTTDGSIATKAGSKNILKADLKKVLNAIILILKANYPDNYKEELRNWGFQKEKY